MCFKLQNHRATIKRRLQLLFGSVKDYSESEDQSLLFWLHYKSGSEDSKVKAYDAVQDQVYIPTRYVNNKSNVLKQIDVAVYKRYLGVCLPNIIIHLQELFAENRCSAIVWYWEHVRFTLGITMCAWACLACHPSLQFILWLDMLLYISYFALLCNFIMVCRMSLQHLQFILWPSNAFLSAGIYKTVGLDLSPTLDTKILCFLNFPKSPCHQIFCWFAAYFVLYVCHIMLLLTN